jgi:hypothetical protein
MNDAPPTADGAAAVLSRTLACCAQARWRPLLNDAELQEPSGQGDAEPLLQAIAADVHRLRDLRLAPGGPGDGADALANEPLTLPRLAVNLAFQQLQLAEQFLLLGREQAAEQRAAAFLQGLQTALQILPDQGLFSSDPHAPSPLDAALAPALVERLRQQLALAERLRRGGLPEHLLLVLGMHRSGTSALAGLLCSHGYDGPGDPMPPDPNNPRGYWESMGLYALNDDLLRLLGSDWSDPAPLPPGWDVTPAANQWRSRLLDHLALGFSGARCAVVKDPRFCVLIEGLLPWLESGLLDTTLLLPLRHPLEVAHSLHVRDGLPLREGLRLWLAHVFAAERLSRPHRRCILPFEQVLEQPLQVVALVNRLVGRTPAVADGAADPAGEDHFIDPGLRHQRRELLDAQRRGLEAAGVAELALAEDLHATLAGSIDPATDREGLTRLERLHRRWLSLRPDGPRRAAPGENDPAG